MACFKNAGDAICSGLGLRFDSERCEHRHRGFTQRRRDARCRNRCEEPMWLLKRLENLRKTKKSPTGWWCGSETQGNIDSGEIKDVFKGRMTLSSPRWSRPRSLELVAGSGMHSGSDNVYDVHGNLSKGRSCAHGADHPITTDFEFSTKNNVICMTYICHVSHSKKKKKQGKKVYLINIKALIDDILVTNKQWWVNSAISLNFYLADVWHVDILFIAFISISDLAF